MDFNKLAYDLIYGEKDNLQSLHSELHVLLQNHVKTTDSIVSTLIDSELLNEIRSIDTCRTDVSIYFGKTLRDLKCVIVGDDGIKEYEIYIKYHGPKKIAVNHVDLPDSPLQHIEYSAIDDIVVAFKRHIQSLTNYFYALERIDQMCSVIEPVRASFKEDYRRIFLGMFDA